MAGTIRSLPEGTEVEAVVTCRREIRDFLRFGRLMLFGFILLVGVSLLFVLEGSSLTIAMLALALGGASVAAVGAFLEATMTRQARSSSSVGELTTAMRRVLQH